MKARAVDRAGDHFTNVEGLAKIGRDDPGKFFRIVERVFGSDAIDRGLRLAVHVGENVARDFESVVVVFGQVIGDARNAAVNFAATEFFSA